MIPMLDTSNPLDQCEAEIGLPCEQLLTPLTRFSRQRSEQFFAIDNGAFTDFDVSAFYGLLRRERESRHLCRFVAVPDVVGSARRTLEAFEHWHARLHGWPLALVAQDGQENLPIPWQHLRAIFIGGSTDWKLGPYAAQIIKAGILMGKWVHVGRVNTPGRYEYFRHLGAHSCDGSGLARFSHMREAIYRSTQVPPLFLSQNEVTA